MPDAPHTVADALAGLQALKDEHRPLVAKVAADPGMDPETRAMILEHVEEEEEEWIARARALSESERPGGGAGPGAPGRAGLTVGSLQQTAAPSRGISPGHRPGTRATVGSLRRE